MSVLGDIFQVETQKFALFGECLTDIPVNILYASVIGLIRQGSRRGYWNFFKLSVASVYFLKQIIRVQLKDTRIGADKPAAPG